MKKLCLLLACVINISADAQQLVTDSLFGTNGFAEFPIPSSPECTEIIDLQNGYFLIGGYNYNSAFNDYRIDMTRSDYCGDIDSTFGTNGVVVHTFSQRNMAFDFELQDDGKILSCGIESTSNAGSAQIPYVSRFNADGSPDTTFGTMGSNSLRYDNISSGRFFGVGQMSDGRIACAGYSTGNINGGTSGFGAMRFTSTGVLDSTFDGDGIVRHPVPVANGLAAGFLTSNNSIIGAGGWVDPAFVIHFMVTCWDSTGALDPSFGYGGYFMDSLLSIDNDIVAVRDSLGFIIMASDVVPNANSILLLRLAPSGFPDPTFGADGYALAIHPSIYAVRGIQLMSNGRYLLLGNTPIGSGFCMMLNHDGSPDVSFGNAGYMDAPLAPTLGPYAKGMIELPNGQWVFAGNGIGLSASRFTTQSNVPHITQQISYLQTTGIGTYQWFLNDTAITGATNDTLNFTQNGSYTVLLTADYGCTYLSDPYIVINSGINELAYGSITLSPNPAENEMQINNATGMDIRLYVCTVQGKEIQSIEATTGITTWDISHLTPGIYFARSTDGMALRFIKK